jgi:hypothetical protein
MHSCDIYCVGILGLVFFLWAVLFAVIRPDFLYTLTRSFLLDYFWKILLVSFAESCLQAIHSAEECDHGPTYYCGEECDPFRHHGGSSRLYP